MTYGEALREAREHLRYVSPVGSGEIYVWNPYSRCLLSLTSPTVSLVNPVSLEDMEKDWEIIESISNKTINGILNLNQKKSS